MIFQRVGDFRFHYCIFKFQFGIIIYYYVYELFYNHFFYELTWKSINHLSKYVCSKYTSLGLSMCQIEVTK